MLVADALDLRHRLPKTWAKVQSGRAKAWVGRKLAQTTRNETARGRRRRRRPGQSKWVHKMGWGRLEKIALAAITEADPAAAASQPRRPKHRKPGCGCARRTTTASRTSPSAPSPPTRSGSTPPSTASPTPSPRWEPTTTRTCSAAAPSASSPSPKHALDLLARAQAVHAGPAPTGTRRRTPWTPGPKAVLYVHLTDQALTTGKGVARVEGEGPVTIGQAHEWLGHCAVTVKPVIDLNAQAPADAYEVPDRLREATHLISPTDCFPYATNQSRKVDLDHTDRLQTQRTARPNQNRQPRPPHPVPPQGQNPRRLARPATLARSVSSGNHPTDATYLVDHTGTRHSNNRAQTTRLSHPPTCPDPSRHPVRRAQACHNPRSQPTTQRPIPLDRSGRVLSPLPPWQDRAGSRR